MFSYICLIAAASPHSWLEAFLGSQQEKEKHLWRNKKAHFDVQVDFYFSTTALQHNSTTAQQHYSTTALQHNSTTAQQHNSTTAQQHNSTVAQQHFSTTAQQDNSTDTQQHWRTTALQDNSTAAHQNSSTAALQHKSTAAKQNNSPAAPQYHSKTAQQHNSTAGQQRVFLLIVFGKDNFNYDRESRKKIAAFELFPKKLFSSAKNRSIIFGNDIDLSSDRFLSSWQ